MAAPRQTHSEIYSVSVAWPSPAIRATAPHRKRHNWATPAIPKPVIAFGLFSVTLVLSLSLLILFQSLLVLSRSLLSLLSASPLTNPPRSRRVFVYLCCAVADPSRILLPTCTSAHRQFFPVTLSCCVMRLHVSYLRLWPYLRNGP